MSNPQRSVIFRNKDFTVKKPEEKQVSAGFSYNMVLVDSVWGAVNIAWIIMVSYYH